MAMDAPRTWCYSVPMAGGAAAKAARSATRSGPLRLLARAGYAVNGLLHGVIGIIAIGVAIGAGGGEADQSGALAKLAEVPGGAALLWVIVVGLAALGLWQIVQTIVVVGADQKRKWAHRLGEFGKAVAYFAIAATTFTFARGRPTNAVNATYDFSAGLLAAPGGVILLIVLGIGVLGIGGYFFYKGAMKKFTDDIVVPSGTAGGVVIMLGVVGYVAKGVALCAVGILFVIAAATLDPSKATGLDGALKALVALPFGAAILVVVGAGLIAYGLYCCARARQARLS
ncbi:DUF1206 domain-containing protein [Pseudarthrobacter sp. P1]|uniref:DUF1206 domain-containing protein n=1 Tax=Pseudarthrobacter sp. P1 TaxID=3418418 RepID=UPI003CF8AF4A